eukprot:3466856-Alexandrium_andersonii.AAC.1
MCQQLLNLDVSSNVLRHITGTFARNFVHEVDAAMAGSVRGNKHEDHQGEVHRGERGGVAE